MTRHTHDGFTLIELLVVITIIVVLLALLTPALDRAIYQAELVVCQAQLDAIGSSTTTYAFDHRRRYPWRSAVESPEDNTMSYMIAGNNAWHLGWGNRSGTLHDDRPVLRSYLAINKYLNCPLNSETDFEDTPPAASVFSDYDLWFGWHYTDGPGGPPRRGMKKIGDRFTTNGYAYSEDGSRERAVRQYAVLAGDHWFLEQGGNALYESSHSDRDGFGSAYNRDGEDLFASTPTGPFSMVHSGWSIIPPHGRTFDLNFAMSDGSVLRLREVEAPFDPRLHYILNEQGEGGSFAIVPAGP